MPFVEQNVWGIGESIGLVSPLTGGGIVQAMNSAAILERNWESPGLYSKSILSVYKRLRRESSLVRRQVAGKRITVLDIPVIRRALNESGVYLTPKSSFKLLVVATL